VARAGLPWDRWIAAISSLGSLGAAAATFLTVREMRAGRILSSRARLTTIGADRPIQLKWKVRPTVSAPSISESRALVRNASQGVARDIRAKWEVLNAITATDVEAVRELLPSDTTLVVAAGGFALEFGQDGMVLDRCPVSVSSFTPVGDLGPTQEVFQDIPVTVLNHAAFKWLAMMGQIEAGVPIIPRQVPTIHITFTHDSPYEKSLQDKHIAKLYLKSYRFIGNGGTKLSSPLTKNWHRAELELRLEITSEADEALPTTTV